MPNLQGYTTGSQTSALFNSTVTSISGNKYPLDINMYLGNGSAISTTNRLPVDASLSISGDVQIGAVELKNATDDTRAVVKTDGTNNGLVVIQNSQPLPTGASRDTSLAGIGSYISGISIWDYGRDTSLSAIGSYVSGISIINYGTETSLSAIGSYVSGLSIINYGKETSLSAIGSYVSGIEFNQINNVGSVYIFGANAVFAQDKATYATTTIDYPHHEVHEGKSFTAQNFQVTASGGEFNLGLTTAAGSTWVHAIESIDATSVTIFRLWEGATISGGTADVCVNRNRNSTNTPTAICVANPVISGASPTSGTLLAAQTYGDASNPVKKATGGGRGGQEWVLKSGTSYLFNIKSGTADNRISARLEWYEHTDRTQQW